jgi:hypothetical protein
MFEKMCAERIAARVLATSVMTGGVYGVFDGFKECNQEGHSVAGLTNCGARRGFEYAVLGMLAHLC